MTLGAALLSSPNRNVAISARVITSLGLKAPPEVMIPLEASPLMASRASGQVPSRSTNPPSRVSSTSTPTTRAARAMNTAIWARVTSCSGE